MPRRGGNGGKAKPGDRRVVFSGKAKKEYLKEKRERKAAAADATWAAGEDARGVGAGEMSGEDAAGVESSVQPTDRLTSSLGKSGLHNALSTIVLRELDSEVERRKRLATVPVRTGTRGAAMIAPSPVRGYGDVGIPHSVVATTAMDAVTAAGVDVGEAEAAFFREWLRRVYGRYRPEQLSTFEHNPMVWKQLWGTVAGATLVAVVADVRNPLFHLPQSLYSYVSEHCAKPLVVVLTKTDLVPPDAVTAWQDAIEERFPLVRAVVPFTSAASKAYAETRLAARRRAIRASLKAFDDTHRVSRAEGVDALLETAGASRDQRAIVRAGVMLASGSGRGGIDEALRLAGITRTGEPLPEAGHDGDDDGGSELGHPSSTGAEASAGDGGDASGTAKTDGGQSQGRGRRKPKAKGRRRPRRGKGDDSDDDDGGAYATRLAARQEVADELESFKHKLRAAGTEIAGTTLTAATTGSSAAATLRASLRITDWSAQPRVVVGVIGQPNVGKSSLINALTGAKRVSVSRTAGHTKRLQHIPVCPGLTVLDCPGLLFPHCYGSPAASDGTASIAAAAATASFVPRAPEVVEEAAAEEEEDDEDELEGERAPLEDGEIDRMMEERAEHRADSGDDEEPEPDSGSRAGAEGSTPTMGCTDVILGSDSVSGSIRRAPAWREDADRNRAMQECLGVVPLAQVREPYTAVRFLAERLPLEHLYGLKPVDPEPSCSGASDGHPWSAWDICESLAIKRGIFHARTGRPDAHAAGRAILQDAVDGILPVFFVPHASVSTPASADDADPTKAPRASIGV